jgi:hypothetical protein
MNSEETSQVVNPFGMPQVHTGVATGCGRTDQKFPLSAVRCTREQVSHQMRMWVDGWVGVADGVMRENQRARRMMEFPDSAADLLLLYTIT